MPPLATDLFDYVLPPHLIAQTPAAKRDASRLLVVDRAAHTFAHHHFADLPQFLRAGDTLFRNNAAVLPARLHARRPTGGAVECFLLRPTDDDRTWRCLVKPGRRLPVDATFAHPDGAFTGRIVAREADGAAIVRFTTPGNEPITAVANRVGDVPLPPYISRPDAIAPQQRATDLERYQTVYANTARQVAVAAPTAGLHFTPELLATLAAQGVGTAEMTLHVGLGTFKPISTDTVEEHQIHRELYEVPVATQHALFPPRSGRRVAVGTTSVRTIEDFLARNAAPLERDVVAEAGLFIYPPRAFRGVDALITNFHQPRSTLMCLVASFLAPGNTDGIAWLRELYAEAIAREYRFFSYGDAMLIL
ncbi:tRNA preQ1(34) S-adenosylmethionine ribosyltransferase-isomerase QueA [Opitutus sp. ER46]|uniref:tRNA preQ1(34) S-adenosylmethionine ribosyltransferase-isomerase QueA n=1 Tax=Opitutus sp. ER46 TaxID=2161864 RepID=UPI000D327EAB|nr:tRNA preQ1(34) S-adenosylmethionine ribosyltransferase-isomerase QueA [Opitutus sp. ER46]PTX96405.1 tRNA preQ1(34) S-adenosylmethionine ribosyltransferase-isomerase QueA [Opitutus sp. ER46]